MRSKLAFYSGLVARFALVSAVSGMIMSPVAITSREEREGEKIAVNVRAAEHAGVAEMNLNYGHLHTVPHALTESTYCRKKIQKLYLKGNIIHELVLHDVYRKLYTAIICHHISLRFLSFHCAAYSSAETNEKSEGVVLAFQFPRVSTIRYIHIASANNAISTYSTCYIKLHLF